MSESPTTPPPKPKTRLPMYLVVASVAGLFVFLLSFGGLAWWLLHRAGFVLSVSHKGSRSHPVGDPGEAREIELDNGTDLDGWDFDPDVWSVRNGVIYGHQKRGGYGSSLFWRDTDIADFELRFRFRLVRGNSGIYYRANRLANFDVGGYEFEIYTNKTGNLADNGTDREKRRLHRTEAGAPVDSEWHEGVIRATGPRLVHLLDGKILCDVEDTDLAAPRTGAIALAITSSTIVEFKDIRLNRTRPTQ